MQMQPTGQKGDGGGVMQLGNICIPGREQPPELSTPAVLRDPPKPSVLSSARILLAHVAATSSDTDRTQPTVEFMSEDRNGVKNSPKPRKPAQTGK